MPKKTKKQDLSNFPDALIKVAIENDVALVSISQHKFNSLLLCSHVETTIYLIYLIN